VHVQNSVESEALKSVGELLMKDWEPVWGSVTRRFGKNCLNLDGFTIKTNLRNRTGRGGND
jgi:hypothetical protein